MYAEPLPRKDDLIQKLWIMKVELVTGLLVEETLNEQGPDLKLPSTTRRVPMKPDLL